MTQLCFSHVILLPRFCQARRQYVTDHMQCNQGKPCTNCSRRFPQPICEYDTKVSKRSADPPMPLRAIGSFLSQIDQSFTPSSANCWTSWKIQADRGSDFRRPYVGCDRYQRPILAPQICRGAGCHYSDRASNPGDQAGCRRRKEPIWLLAFDFRCSYRPRQPGSMETLHPFNDRPPDRHRLQDHQPSYPKDRTGAIQGSELHAQRLGHQ